MKSLDLVVLHNTVHRSDLACVSHATHDLSPLRWTTRSTGSSRGGAQHNTKPGLTATGALQASSD